MIFWLWIVIYLTGLSIEHPESPPAKRQRLDPSLGFFSVSRAQFVAQFGSSVRVDVGSSSLVLGRSNPALIDHLDAYVSRTAAIATLHLDGSVHLEAQGSNPMRILRADGTSMIVTKGHKFVMYPGEDYPGICELMSAR